jgi:hypothetical protein
VTSFPDSPSFASDSAQPTTRNENGHSATPKYCYCLNVESLVRIRFKKDHAGYGAIELAGAIVTRSSSTFLNLHKGRSELRLMDIFRHAIGGVVNTVSAIPLRTYS